MTTAEFVYEVLLAFDIKADHAADVRKMLIEKYGFSETVMISYNKRDLEVYRLPESTLFHPHTSTDSALATFESVCNELHVKHLNCIAVKCTEGRALQISKA